MAYRANVVDSGATLGYTNDPTVRANNKTARRPAHRQFAASRLENRNVQLSTHAPE